jgi:hypothetical protein
LTLHCSTCVAPKQTIVSTVGLLLKRLLLTTAAQLLLHNFSKPVSKLLWGMCQSLTLLECLELLCHVLPVFPPWP